ncbi:MAG: DUF2336 domain-containing protein [Rhizobiales bacterium]|nr:DUF2336 domain-containing protein [Hyphomicrobiales bacterium]
MNDEPTLGLDTAIFHDVIENGTAEQRLALADQLAGFLANGETSSGERSQVVPVVLKLAVDPAADVRHRLALGLAAVADLDADILFSIVSDEDEIALPFLAATPALNHWHMLAVLRVGDAARHIAIAQRPDLSKEALAYMVKSSGLEACLALFCNEAARLGDREYHTLYARFGQTHEMAERLLSQPDLPLDIRITQAKRASHRMHQLMAERGWIPANDAAELVADAEETAILRILVEASEAELIRVVGFLVSKAMLTPSIILRAACLGEMHVVERALAHLAGVPVAKARDQMAGRGMSGFKGLHGKSGLPQSCYGILQAACDVANDEREEGIALDAEGFGRRLIEALMTRYESMPLKDRARHLEFVGRFAEDRVRVIAKRLKADIARAA